MSASSATRRFFAPEVIQTSAMDCGPAALTCLLGGFGISASYGRLREACQTDVDGTSLDTLEAAAGQLGLAAEQIMVPVDHVLLSVARALPALVVVLLPNGTTHFVVAWSRHGRFVQVMDPAFGRRWITRRRFLDELYIHTMPVLAADWHAWAGTDEFLLPLRRRLSRLGLSRQAAGRLVEQALADPGWIAPAALDAVARMAEAVAGAGGLRRGADSAKLVETLFNRARSAPGEELEALPASYWSVRPAPPDEDGAEQVLLRGAVLVRVRGRQEAAGAEEEPAPVSPELVAALEESPARPLRELLGLVRAGGLLAPGAIVSASLLAAAGVVLEGLLLRGLLELGQGLRLAEQRLGAIVGLVIFAVLLLLLELPIALGMLRLARHVEIRLRMAFIRKIPLLGDRYFHSRPISDMAERGHSVHRVRPFLDATRLVMLALFELLLTTAAIGWLYPASAPAVVIAVILIVGLLWVAQPIIGERSLRVRTHNGALGHFYFDALLGLVAVRAHRAERAVRREHESLLVEWARAGFGLQQAAIGVEGLLAAVGFGSAIWLLFQEAGRSGAAGGTLLLVYWALKLPVLAYVIAHFAQQYPDDRNVLLRLLEPLGAPEDRPAGDEQDRPERRDDEAQQLDRSPVSICMEDVAVRIAGHTILEEIDLSISAGCHVAIIGPSGAGKSSLVGLLLGWHRPATGQVCVDGRPLDGRQLERLRAATAWVDPTVQLWNRPLIDNLCYGSSADAAGAAGRAIEQAELHQILEQLPDGLLTPLGEGGALLSGGEGQRVRLGRALLRPNVRLAILDEPFRGLDRERRRVLLARTRSWWRDATLLCITHDVGETLAFERVLVVEGGRIVEDGAPAELAARPGTRYRAMLDTEAAVRSELWSSPIWRRLQIAEGLLVEQPPCEGHDRRAEAPVRDSRVFKHSMIDPKREA